MCKEDVSTELLGNPFMRGELLRLLWPIAALPTVALHLTTNARFVTFHHSVNLAFVMTRFRKDRNLVPFVSGEMCVVHSGQLWLGD